MKIEFKTEKFGSKINFSTKNYTSNLEVNIFIKNLKFPQIIKKQFEFY